MAHFAKYGKAATGHMSKHYERAKEWNRETGKVEYIKFGNENIDTTRSHLNYNLAPERPQGQIGFIKQRMSEIKCQKRDDINVMCSCVITLPRRYEQVGEELVEIPYTEQEQQDFFKESYAQLIEMFGENNVISAYVHLDETTPHMHFAFVPAVEDKKWNEKHPSQPREKLSAKECVNRTMLRTFHRDLQIRLDERFGIDFFPVLNGATIEGNLGVTELKAQRYIDEMSFEMSMIDQDAFRMKLERDDIEIKLSTAQDALKNAQKEVEKMQQQISTLEENKTLWEAKIATLAGQCDIAEERLMTLQTQISSTEAKIKSAEQTYGVLQDNILTAHAQLELANRTVRKRVEERGYGWDEWNRMIAGSREDFKIERSLLREEKEFQRYLRDPENLQHYRQWQHREKIKNDPYHNR